MFQIKCDVHPWMSAYLGVFTNPFFSVTKHGREVHDLRPRPGDLRDHAWHERLGTQTATVTVGANETKTPELQVRRPRREVAIRRATA